MKRRLPTTRKSDFVLVAINLPPVTAEMNRQRPHPSHPGKADTARQAARKASRA